MTNPLHYCAPVHPIRYEITLKNPTTEEKFYHIYAVLPRTQFSYMHQRILQFFESLDSKGEVGIETRILTPLLMNLDRKTPPDDFIEKMNELEMNTRYRHPIKTADFVSLLSFQKNSDMVDKNTNEIMEWVKGIQTAIAMLAVANKKEPDAPTVSALELGISRVASKKHKSHWEKLNS